METEGPHNSNPQISEDTIVFVWYNAVVDLRTQTSIRVTTLTLTLSNVFMDISHLNLISKTGIFVRCSIAPNPDPLSQLKSLS